MNDLAGRIVRHYEQHAEAWAADREQAPWPEQGWHDRLLARLRARAARASILDLGCGSGAPVARFYVAHDCRVTGVDTSPTMIARCRARLPDQTWIVADMRSIALPQRFDAILAQDSFFHLTPDDQRAMFDVFAGHAAPSALLIFNTGPAASEAIGTYRGDPLYHASLDGAVYRSLLARSGFDVIAHVAEDPAAGGRTMWMAQVRSQP